MRLVGTGQAIFDGTAAPLFHETPFPTRHVITRPHPPPPPPAHTLILILLRKLKLKLVISGGHATFLFLLSALAPLPHLFFPLQSPFQLVGLIFMNSRSTAASTVSCKAGNKKNFLSLILICLFPRFLGITVVFENFLLFKATVRCPSSSVPVLAPSREILL